MKSLGRVGNWCMKERKAEEATTFDKFICYGSYNSTLPEMYIQKAEKDRAIRCIDGEIYCRKSEKGIKCLAPEEVILIFRCSDVIINFEIFWKDSGKRQQHDMMQAMSYSSTNHPTKRNLR